MQVCPRPDEGEYGAMLRRLLWTALVGALRALSTMLSRRAAARIWRTLTGEEPPTKK